MKNSEDFFLKFDDDMKERIGKIYRPVVENKDQLQQIQIAANTVTLGELLKTFIKALDNAGAIDGYYYEINDEGRKVLSKEFWAMLEEGTHDILSQTMNMLASTAQNVMINYVGMVLNGSMEPIYDPSLENAMARDKAKASLHEICQDVNTQLAQCGALEETKEGKIRINEEHSFYKSRKESKKDE